MKKHMLLGTYLSLSVHSASRSVFGDMDVLRPALTRTLDKKGGGGGAKPSKRSQGTCLCADPMPLTRTERDLLAGFPPGRFKKAFVKRLKEKYDKL